MRQRILAGIILSLTAATAEAASFTPLGYLPGGNSSTPFALSADGAVVVGYATNSALKFQAFRWQAGVMTALEPTGISFSIARGTSADGSVIAGHYTLNGVGHAARWNNSVVTDLDDPAGYAGSSADAVSADGTVLVGTASNTDADAIAVRWTDGVPATLELPAGFTRSYGEAVSADGTVVVGSADPASSGRQAVRWSDGAMTVLGPGSSWGAAVSADGSVVVGRLFTDSGNEMFRWTDGVMTGLGNLPGRHDGEARDVSADGNVVVGWNGGATYPTDPVIWTPSTGTVRLRDVMIANGVTGLESFTLQSVNAVSADGHWVAGTVRGSDHRTQAYVANITAGPNTDGDSIPDESDNCPNTANEDQADTDGDGRGNMCDNCRLVPNTTPPNNQYDADADGFGNICDADLNNSLQTTSTDYTILRNALNTANAVADLNGSGFVTTADYTILRNRLNTAPGPGAGP